MYGQNIRVIIVPTILAFAYLGPVILVSFQLDSLADLDLLPLVMWEAINGAVFIEQNEVGETVVTETGWGTRLVLASLVTSMTVNALVTGLIVFRIFKVFREVRSVITSEEKSLGITGGTKLRSVIFIIIESGMVLFAIQLARVIVTTTQIEAWYDAFEFIVGIHVMVNVIISSVIVTLHLLITSI